MKQNRHLCMMCMCITLAAFIIGTAFSPARAQDANTLIRFDRSADLLVLKFSGTSEEFSQVFRFESTDTIPLKIISISLVNPESEFSLEQSCDCGGFPVLVVPGDLVGIRLAIKTKDQNLHYNQVRFVLDGGGTPIIYNIEAQRMPTQDVASSSSAELFTISTMPNPSSGNISIHIAGTEKADVEIFDALGKSVAAQRNVTDWRWSGLSDNGVPVRSGNYFIRATSENTDGHLVASTKNISIIR